MLYATTNDKDIVYMRSLESQSHSRLLGSTRLGKSRRVWFKAWTCIEHLPEHFPVVPLGKSGEPNTGFPQRRKRRSPCANFVHSAVSASSPSGDGVYPQ